MKSNLPSGTVTFLFTDIEGSTQLLQRLKQDYGPLLDAQERILRDAIAQHNGRVVDTQGDSFFAAFARATDAVQAGVEVQRVLASNLLADGSPVRVRIGLHTGEPVLAGERYVGIDVHHAARIGSAAHGGQVLLSQTTRDLVQEQLPDGVALRDLGEHRLKDLRTPTHLFQLLIAGLPTAFPPIRTLHTLPNNLPVQLTSFVGREREITQVKKLIKTSRLLTLTGVGGTGKTRLALQTAADLVDQFRYGVWLVEFAAISDPGLIPSTVTSALNLSEQGGRSDLELVTEFLRSRELLLVLDNCEHIIRESARFTDRLLHECPGVHIVVTSREPLGIAGESVWVVPSLSLPPVETPLSPAELDEFEAVKLFAERARLVQPQFEIKETNARAITQICTRLDGIPLALELAAARGRTMGIEQIAARLDQRFRLLTGGSRTALSRQQTLSAMIDWSYDLLSESERMLLQRLAVFTGSFTVEAAEDICSGGEIAENEELDLLLRLVDKSLVIKEEREAESYYRLLETIREYAHDKMFASHQLGPLKNRHAAFFHALAEKADSGLRGPNQVEWLRRLGVMHDNLRGALNWLIETEQTGAALQLARKLDWFWFVRSEHKEGRYWLKRVLALPDAPLFTDACADTLTKLAHHVWIQGGPKQARPPIEQALSIAQAQDDPRNTAKAMAILGLVLTLEHDFVAAHRVLEESKVLFEQLKDRWGYAHAVLCSALGPYLQDALATALAVHKQALAMFRELEDGFFQSVCLRFIGNILVKQGNPSDGEQALTEALNLAQVLGSKQEISSVLWSMGDAAQALGRHAHAVQLFLAARNIVEAVGAWQKQDDVEFEEKLAMCRAALNGLAYARAETLGRSMTMEQAILLALEKNEP